MYAPADLLLSAGVPSDKTLLSPLPLAVFPDPANTAMLETCIISVYQPGCRKLL